MKFVDINTDDLLFFNYKGEDRLLKVEKTTLVDGKKHVCGEDVIKKGYRNFFFDEMSNIKLLESNVIDAEVKLVPHGTVVVGQFGVKVNRRITVPLRVNKAGDSLELSVENGQPFLKVNGVKADQAKVVKWVENDN